MNIAYYPGCSGHGTSTEYEKSTQAVCKLLGLNFQEVPDWSCCGSTPAHAMDTLLSAALSARNLSLASKMGADAVLTPCPSCLANLKQARHRMGKPEFKAEVDSLLDNPTPELTKIPQAYSVLQILLEQVGLDAMKAQVRRPLQGLKIATYYGCLMSRPAEVMQFDDAENPVALDQIMEALGAEVVPFPLKTECCGAAMGIANTEITANLVTRLLTSAKAFGADAVVTACPLCHMNLDLRQVQAEKASGKTFAMPVFYYTQLMGLAFGLSANDLQLEKLAVSPKALLDSLACTAAQVGEGAKS